MNEQQIIWNLIYNFFNSQNLITNQNNILYAYPLATPLPANNDFVIITKIGHILKYNPITDYYFDATTSQLQSRNMVENQYQIDVYSKDNNNAATYAYKLHTYLSSELASNDLINFKMGIGQVEDTIQLTSPLDRDSYLARYMIKCSIHSISELDVNVDFITYPDVSGNIINNFN